AGLTHRTVLRRLHVPRGAEPALLLERQHVVRELAFRLVRADALARPDAAGAERGERQARDDDDAPHAPPFQVSCRPGNVRSMFAMQPWSRLSRTLKSAGSAQYTTSLSEYEQPVSAYLIQQNARTVD